MPNKLCLIKANIVKKTQLLKNYCALADTGTQYLPWTNKEQGPYLFTKQENPIHVIVGNKWHLTISKGEHVKKGL